MVIITILYLREDQDLIFFHMIYVYSPLPILNMIFISTTFAMDPIWI